MNEETQEDIYKEMEDFDIEDHMFPIDPINEAIQEEMLGYVDKEKE